MITTRGDSSPHLITKGGVGCREGPQPLSLTTRSWLRPEAGPSWTAEQRQAAAGWAWWASASALPSALGRPQGWSASEMGLPGEDRMEGESMWRCSQ